MMKTYHGSCHCGAVTFEADLDLTQGTGRCNCTYCSKVRVWGVTTKPAAFRLLTGQDALGAYEFNTKQGQHHFCRTCGVRTHGQANVPELGGEVVSVYLPALDDASVDELLSGPLHYADGLHDNWMNPPAETRHL